MLGKWEIVDEEKAEVKISTTNVKQGQSNILDIADDNLSVPALLLWELKIQRKKKLINWPNLGLQMLKQTEA